MISNSSSKVWVSMRRNGISLLTSLAASSGSRQHTTAETIHLSVSEILLTHTECLRRFFCTVSVASALKVVIMVALCNGGALYFCPVVSFFYLLLLFSSPNLNGHRLHVYHTSTHGVALVSANLECRSEMCCTRLAANTGRKKVAKNRHLHGHHRTNLSDYIFANKACIDNRKKLVKQQYLLHMSS